MSTATLEVPIRTIALRQITEPIHHLPTVEAETGCSGCHLRNACLPGDMSDEQINHLNGLKFARRRVAAGRMLYRQGEQFSFFYAALSKS